MGATLALSAGLAFAQDFEDFDDFATSDSFGSEDGFSSASKLETSGTVSTDVRAYIEKNDDDEIDVEAKPSGNLDLNYSGNKSDLELSLCIDADKIMSHPEDIIDELIIRGRLGDYLTLEAGKMKVVWGKGDKLHVLDNFNADDYADFIIPDYIDRRISTPMLRGIVSLPTANLNIEAVYTPFLPTDRFATSGRWTPAQVSALTNTVTVNAKTHLADTITCLENARTEANTAATLKALGTSEANDALKTMVTAAYTGGKISYTTDEVISFCTTHGMDPTNPSNQQNAAAAILAEKYEDYLAKNLEATNTAYTLALSNASALSSDPSAIYPDLRTLKYGQFGGRATWTLGQIDMGVSYYNGWFKQPSVNASKLDSFLTSYLADGDADEDEKFLAYDKKQTFGVEASSIIWHFNVRGELAYNLTEDMDGNDPWVHNNSIAWLGGFDIDLPFWNSNLNVQEIGTFVLHGDKCDENPLDVDYSKNGYTNNKIAANFTASFMNDKIAPEVTVMYGIENKDLAVLPKITYRADQNLSFTASGLYIWCGDENSEFKAWENNSFVNLGAAYHF